MNTVPIDRDGQDALGEADIFTIKLGGTRAAELAENADHVEDLRSQNKKLIFAISALRSGKTRDNDRTHERAIKYDNDKRRKEGFNTTDHLILLAECVNTGDLDTARDVLGRIRQFTKDTAQEQVESDEKITDTASAIEELHQVIDAVLDELETYVDAQYQDAVHTVGEDRLIRTGHNLFSITGAGEKLAEALYPVYFKHRNINCANVETEDLDESIFGDTNPAEALKNKDQRDMAMRIVTSELRKSVAKLLPDNDVIVSGGYHPGVGTERGYTELTVALLTVAAQRINERIACLIEGDYPLMSADPKKIKDAEFVDKATYDLAFEIFGNTGLGADGGAIHAPALEILARAGIDTVMLNPKDPRYATLIQHYEDAPSEGVRIVASRGIPDALVISGPSIMFEPGVIHDITAWFAQRDISIVQTPSSQVKLSFTFSNGGLPEELLGEFNAFLAKTYGEDSCDAKLIPGQSVIHCLGNDISAPDVPARIGMALALAGVKQRMKTQAYESNAAVIGVDSDDTEKAAAAVHLACIKHRDTDLADLHAALSSQLA